MSSISIKEWIGHHETRFCDVMQVENEYGFCGSSKSYIRSLITTAKAAFGEDMIIFTTDPPSIVESGSLAGDEVYT